MKLRLNTPVDTEARPMPLTGRTTRHGRSTKIENADTRSPLSHSVNTVDPHENAVALRELVRAKIEGLARAGSLDQDNLEALSLEINSWLHTWTGLAHRHAQSRREVAELLLAQCAQSLEEVSVELAQVRKRRAEVSGVRDELLVRSGLTVPPLELRLNNARRELPESKVRATRTAPALPEADQLPASDAPAELTAESVSETPPIPLPQY